MVGHDILFVPIRVAFEGTHVQGNIIRIGTRGSPLALAQAREVRSRLMAAHGLSEDAFEIVVITTSGDTVVDRPLSEVGGKGLFTKELETALFERRIEIAVHSMKDMATKLPDGLIIGAALPREDVRDAFISLNYSTISELPENAVVGTSSLRRRAQVLKIRPDVRVIEFRGNVQTRLKKLAEGMADATFLACAGLKRLGMHDRITAIVEIDEMLPAVAQAAVGVQLRADDEETNILLAPLNDEETAICVACERSFLARLEGSCRTPIGGLATYNNGIIELRGQILSLDGSQSYEGSRGGPAQKAAQIGDALGSELLEAAGPGFLST